MDNTPLTKKSKSKAKDLIDKDLDEIKDTLGEIKDTETLVKEETKVEPVIQATQLSVKSKKIRSPTQQEVFKKAQEKRKENIEKHGVEKKIAKAQQIINQYSKPQNTNVEQQKAVEQEEEEEEEVIKVKYVKKTKPKVKTIIVEESDTEDDEHSVEARLPSVEARLPSVEEKYILKKNKSWVSQKTKPNVKITNEKTNHTSSVSVFDFNKYFL